jgi:multiple sugar transport system substrate-binding protein
MACSAPAATATPVPAQKPAAPPSPTEAAKPAAAQPTAPPKPTDPPKPAAADAPKPTVAPAASKPSAQPVNIEFWVDEAAGGADKMWAKAVAEFEQQNPNVKAKAVVVPYDDAETKALTSIAGNVPIDLVYVHPMWNATFAVKGVTVPLDTYMTRDWTKAQLDDFYTGAITYFKWAGKTYGLPNYSGPQVFYYNKDLLAKAGLEDPWALYKKGEWTVQKFDEFIPKLTTGSGVEKVYGYSGVNRSVRMQAGWLWGFGGEIWSDGFKETLVHTDQTAVGWEYLANQVKKGYAPTAAETKALPSGLLGGFNSGRLGIYYSYRQNVYQFKEGGNWGVVPIHKHQNGQEYNRDGPTGLGLTKLSKNPDEAWKFLHFASTRGVEVLMEARATGPTTRSQAQGKVWRDSLLPWESAEVYDIAARQVDNRVLTHVPGMSEIDRTIQAALDKVILGEATAKQAMTEAKPKIDGILKETMS